MKYWIIIDDRHAGPFSAQQLLDTGLTADTLVWFEGIPDGRAGVELEEDFRLAQTHFFPFKTALIAFDNQIYW